MKYFKRLLGLPFFAGFALVALLFHWFSNCKYFMMYGGEAMAYEKKHELKGIADVYRLLEKSIKA